MPELHAPSCPWRKSSDGRATDSDSVGPGFESFFRFQDRCGDRNGYGRACKARICGFDPHPHLQCSRSSVEERRFSTPGPRGFESCREHGPAAQRMSAEILPRRTQVRFLSGLQFGASTGRGPARPAKPLVPTGMRVGISALLHLCGLGPLVDYRPSKAARRVRFSQPAPDGSLPLAARRADLHSDNTGSSPVGSTNTGEWRSRQRNAL
jgi:hypothetical protein